jgi:hypothetical protein
VTLTAVPSLRSCGEHLRCTQIDCYCSLANSGAQSVGGSPASP